MFPANLSRSAHYLNLQPQQPLLTPPISPRLLSPTTERSPISFFSPILSLLCSLSPPHSSSLCLSLTVSSSFEFPWADVSARVLTASSTHNWAVGGSRGVCSWWEGLRFLARFGEERRILGFCLPLPLSPSSGFAL